MSTLPTLILFLTKIPTPCLADPVGESFLKKENPSIFTVALAIELVSQVSQMAKISTSYWKEYKRNKLILFTIEFKFNKIKEINTNLALLLLERAVRWRFFGCHERESLHDQREIGHSETLNHQSETKSVVEWHQ